MGFKNLANIKVIKITNNHKSTGIACFLLKMLNLYLTLLEKNGEAVRDPDSVGFLVLEESPRGLLWPDMIESREI